MKYFSHCALSSEDMDRLAGTNLMEILVRNRLVIKYDKNEEHITSKELGLFELTNPFYLHVLDKKNIEILFSDPSDLKTIDQNLSIIKLGQN